MDNRHIVAVEDSPVEAGNPVEVDNLAVDRIETFLLSSCCVLLNFLDYYEDRRAERVVENPDIRWQAASPFLFISRPDLGSVENYFRALRGAKGDGALVFKLRA